VTAKARKIAAKPSAGEPYAGTLAELIPVLIESFVDRGVSRPWAHSLVKMDQDWLQANMGRKTLAQLQEALFAPEMPDTPAEYRENVAWFLEGYGVETGHTESVLDKRKDEVEKAFAGRLPPWSVAAQLLHEVKDIAAYAIDEDGPRDDRIKLEFADKVKARIGKLVNTGLMGTTEEEVVKTLVHQGIIGLVRDGLI
jgi:hypothetical protein